MRFFYIKVHFIAPTKYTAFIIMDIEGASPECFGTSAPGSGTTKCESLKSSGYWKAVIYM
jgi:hypothetical protein